MQSEWRRFVLIRLALMPLTLWVVVTVLFILLRIVPGDPVDVILGGRAPAAVREQMREELGITGSLPTQYFAYLWQLLHLDLGTSYTTSGRSVVEIIQTFFPATLELAIAGLTIALALSLPLGILAALNPRQPIDSFARLSSIVSYAIPLFWLGMLLQLIFGVYLRWLPIGSRLPPGTTPPAPITGMYVLDALLAGDWSLGGLSLYHLVLPGLTLGLVMSGTFTRMIRVHLWETMQQPFVNAARAKGLPERRVIAIHATRPALIPILTVVGLALAGLMGGALLTEVTFSWPGLASRLVQAIGQRDYPVVQGLVVFFAVVVVMVSFLLDLVNAWLDPRVRY